MRFCPVLTWVYRRGDPLRPSLCSHHVQSASLRESIPSAALNQNHELQAAKNLSVREAHDVRATYPEVLKTWTGPSILVSCIHIRCELTRSQVS